jgi:hypothetical protein
MRTIPLALLILVIKATVAHSDFVVKTTPPPGAPRSTTSAPPTAATSDAPTQTDIPPADSPPDPTPAPAPPRFKMAYGFGNRIPLGFACRQVVPRAVKVVYGPGANPQQIVSWKGGDTWNHVLRDAVKPLGLHLVMSTMVLEIRQ